jgi:hypothetical protein
MTRSERFVFALLAAYACGLLGLHALYYAGIFTAAERDPSVWIHLTRTFFVTSFFLLICIKIMRSQPFGLLVVAAASYSGATFIEDFLVIESSFFLPEHPLAGSLYALRPLFILMLVYWAVLRRSIESA